MVLIVHMGCVQGDIAFLEAARTEAGTGTQLVVGLLNDADVAMATGNPFLPVVPLQERALALLSHRAVEVDVALWNLLERQLADSSQIGGALDVTRAS